MRILSCIALLMIVCPDVVTAQDRDEMQSIMELVGAAAPEEVDRDEMERLSDFLRCPLLLNHVSESELVASGLFTDYQIASLSDYRARHGDVMSLVELAAIDGFCPHSVERLRPFVSLAGGKYEVRPQKKVDGDVAVRGAYKMTDGRDWNYGLKCRMDISDRLFLSIGFNRPYGGDGSCPEEGSLSLEYRLRRKRLRVLAGDFNARFGQGLALWNGTFMTSLHAPESFMRKPSGLSRCRSYNATSAYSGVAGEISLGKFSISSFVAFPGIKNMADRPDRLTILPAVNAVWRGKTGHVSTVHFIQYSVLTGVAGAVSSADASFCIDGTNIFGEVAYEWIQRQVRGVVGTDFAIGEKIRMAALARGLSGESLGAALSGSAGSSYDRHSAVVSMETVMYSEPKGNEKHGSTQLRTRLDWIFRHAGLLTLKIRADFRYRTWGQPFRTSLRTDVGFEKGGFCVNVRMDALKCLSYAASVYAEGGWCSDVLSFHLRQGFFKVDDWDDRIYVYERDIPGAFNVPALYGRGLWTSVLLSCRALPSVKISLRVSYTAYPFMAENKPGRAELKLYSSFRF